MLRRVFSDLQSFKTLEFKAGLNLLLADKRDDSTDLQTRNGVGKTSLVELIHFVLGANADPGSLFRTTALASYHFGLEIELPNSASVTVRRAGYQANRFTFDDLKGELDWQVEPSISQADLPILSLANWRRNLAFFYFGLQEEEQDNGAYSPSYRSLISYYVRREHSGGFVSPFKHATIQQLADQQVSLEFLLALDWTLSRDWQLVRDREKTFVELRRAAGRGLLGDIVGTTAALRTELAVAERQMRDLEAQASTFQVLPQYRETEIEASTLAREIAELSNANTLDRHLLQQIDGALQSDTVNRVLGLNELFQELGIVLPDLVLRRFDEVESFHASVIQNRQSYLTGETQSAIGRIAERDQKKSQLDQRRLELMGILETHGALDQFMKVQNELTVARAKVETLRQQFETAEQVEGQKTELDIKRSGLYLRLQEDFREQAERLVSAILAFQEASSGLYEAEGSLTIEASPNGPEFDVLIPASRSKGIGNMQVFCFDMMLMKLRAQTGLGPDFLVHDSHLFDGVDSRQTAHALEIGARWADEFNFQYIVTLNSDMLPDTFSDGFSIDKFMNTVRLTDASLDGGLFGMRFD